MFCSSGSLGSHTESTTLVAADVTSLLSRIASFYTNYKVTRSAAAAKGWPKAQRRQPQLRDRVFIKWPQRRIVRSFQKARSIVQLNPQQSPNSAPLGYDAFWVNVKPCDNDDERKHIRIRSGRRTLHR